jgi:putative Ca2+/H+ antiporter (TMEM165/GDT1 family)
VFLKAFWLAFSLVFLAELGDRTQVLVLTLATKYRALVVFAGAMIGVLTLHLLAAVIGQAAGKALPLFWINLLGGISFIIFGLWGLRSSDEVEEDKPAESRFGALLAVFLTFVLAEVGDKSTLLTVTVASQQPSFIGVWLGSSLGMALSDGIAIMIGSVFGKRLPQKLIKYGSVAVFIALGIYRIIEAFRH